jgi:hypothetical protein
MSIREHVSFMLYLFSSFDGIIINITTGILNESYIKLMICLFEHSCFDMLRSPLLIHTYYLYW